MIKFIREYTLYTLQVFDVIYTKDGKNVSKVITRTEVSLPQTARDYLKFCKEHGRKTEHIKQVKGKIEPEIEIIYEA